LSNTAESLALLNFVRGRTRQFRAASSNWRYDSALIPDGLSNLSRSVSASTVR